MTYREALEQGWKKADTALHRGYVSRKVNVDNQPCLEAKGRRKGCMYVELPNPNSTQYLIRQYIVKEV